MTYKGRLSGRVLRYLSRYTHRAAISDHRLVEVSDDHVTFTWKDYRDGSCIKPIDALCLPRFSSIKVYATSR